MVTATGGAAEKVKFWMPVQVVDFMMPVIEHCSAGTGTQAPEVSRAGKPKLLRPSRLHR